MVNRQGLCYITQRAWIGAVALTALMLYLPFVSNPLVFDDQALFGAGLARFAITPLDLAPRTFPYFTIAVTEVLSGQSIVVHRILGIALHCSCALLLAMLVRSLLMSVTSGTPAGAIRERELSLAAALCGMLFVAHPVAVYGAGYLVQRTIVLATLFALASALLLDRAVKQGKPVISAWAALACTMAIMSKEHSIMLPLAAFAVVAMRHGPIWSHRSTITLYLVLCLPAQLLALASRGGVVGETYEPDIGNILDHIGIPLLSQPMGSWFVSSLVQMGLFWDYLLVWVMPMPQWLSIDLRIDIAARWELPWVLVRAVMFALLPGLLMLIARSRLSHVRLAAGGLMWCWIMYLTELAAVRFQEPFVLYRSYLWAPGLFIAVFAWLPVLPRRAVAVVGFATVVVLGCLSFERLDSFSSSDKLWRDAAAKLPDPKVPGAVRIYYNRGLSRIRTRDYQRALADFEHIVALAPNDFRTILGRGVARMRLGYVDQALADFDRAVTLSPNIADIHLHRGNALRQLGRDAAALQAYESAASMGHLIARIRLQQMKSPGAAQIRVEQ